MEINFSLVFFSFIFILLSLDQSMIMSVVSCRCEGERLLTLSDTSLRVGPGMSPVASLPAW